MSLIQYRKPYSLLSDLQHDLSSFFSNQNFDENASMMTAADWSPSVDIVEEDDHYLIHADVPGIKPADIDVSMDKGVLTIKGHREDETKQQSEKFKRVERVRGSFFRRFTLPEVADIDNIQAKTVDGVLTVTIPKGLASKPRKITVN
jgi:HSP20 family protein